MDAEKYLKAAERPRIVAMDDEGNETPMQIKSMDRPALKKLKSMCARRGTGHIMFIDTFIGTIEKESLISKVLLYYDDFLVAGRVLPDSIMFAGDSIEVTFTYHMAVNLKGEHFVNNHLSIHT